MAKSSRLYLAVVFTCLILGIFTFQNCSEVAFKSTDAVSFNGRLGTIQTQSIELNSVTQKPPLRIVTIVDNSQSMTEIQQSVANAFIEVADVTKNFSGTAEIYTTTQNISDKVLGDKISVVSQSFSNKDEVGPADNFIKGKLFELPSSFTQNSSNQRGPLVFNEDMSDSQFNSFKTDFSNSMKAIGVSGSSDEMGICTLLRYAQANKNKSGYYAYIMATNEEDTIADKIDGKSATDLCLEKEEQAISRVPKSSAKICTSENDPDCTSHNYRINFGPSYSARLLYDDYRKEYERLNYSLNTNVGNKTENVKYQLNRHQERITYSIFSFRELAKIKMAVISKDGKPIPGQLETKTVYITQNNGGSQYIAGQCPSTSSCNDKESLIRNLLTTEEKNRWEANNRSCSYECQSQVQSGPDYVFSYGNNKLSYQAGTCQEAKKNNNSCGPSELNLALSVAGVSNAALISNCQYRCNDSKPSYNFQDSSSAMSCQVNEIKNCTNDDINRISTDNSTSVNGLNANSISSCQRTCTGSSTNNTSSKTFAELKLKSRNGNFCPGENSYRSTQEITNDCTSAERSAVVNYLNSKGGAYNQSNITSCSYKCRQQVRSDREIALIENKNGTDPRFNNICNSGEENRVSTEAANKGAIYIPGTCEYDSNLLNSISCNLNNQQLPGGCGNPVALAKKCSNYLDGANSPRTLAASNSCSWISGSKNVISGYDDAPQQVKNFPLINSDVQELTARRMDIAQKAKSKLDEAHGDNYNLAMFYYPPGTPESAIQDSSASSINKTWDLLADSVGARAVRGSVQDNDFSDQLDFILNLAVTKIDSAYTLKLEDGQMLTSVAVAYEDGRVTVLNEDQWNFSNNTLALVVPDDPNSSNNIIRGAVRIVVSVFTPAPNN